MNDSFTEFCCTLYLLIQLPDMPGYLLSFFKWFAIVLLLLLFAGTVFEQYTRRRLNRPGKTLTYHTINDMQLHYVKKGTGNTTVIFQSGMGSSHSIWQEIQENIAHNATTLSYDRNGIMWSQENNLPVTNRQVTEELEALLEKTHCPKPYILVGHSMAGVYLRSFINKHKEDIAGIIFVEAAHPEQIKKASPALLKATKIPPHWLIKLAVNTGLYRALFHYLPISPEIPMHHRMHTTERDYFYKSYHKVLEELKNVTINFADATQHSSFGDIPLTLIMGTNEVRFANIRDNTVKQEYRALLMEVQHDLLRLSTNSKLIKAPNSGHIVQIHDAALIIDEIKTLLAPLNQK
jgi:pimeloyl-ACP methyl ester carboxylesterase